MKTFILECQSVSKNFGPLKAVSNVSFQLYRREFLAILGPSGCGKSTILRMIAGLETLDRGKVLLQNQVVSERERLVVPEQRGLGMVFQDISLFPHLNVSENIAFGLKGSNKEKRRRVKEMLALVSLADCADKMPHMLSGGQQQRVAVARSLAPSPALILLDEPFSSLDYQLRVQLRQDIRDILRQKEVSVILVTHDQSEAFTFADRMVIMKQGNIIQEGTPTGIYHAPIDSWVATFVGEANFLPFESASSYLDPFSQKHDVVDLNGNSTLQKKSQHLMVRPEDILVEGADYKKDHGIIQHIDFSGDQQILKIQLLTGNQIKARVSSRENWQRDQRVTIRIKHFTVFSHSRMTCH